jgi:hypothetical protein
MEQFAGLSKALNTTFELDVVEVEKKEITIDEKIKALEIQTATYKTDKVVLEDKNYIREELMALLASNNHIIACVEDEIRKPPISPRLLETYSMVLTQSKELLRELRQLSINTSDLELAQRKMDQNFDLKTGSVTQNIQNNTFNLSSSDLDKMIDNAKSSSRIDLIEIDFEKDSQIK